MIDLSCTCGRTYQVPPTKAGRKLQCKRCGAVTRIPHPDADDVFVVPFQVTEEAAEEPLELAVAEPVHRCPSCGTTDDISVVVCVRCGYDWRSGNRVDDVAQASLDHDQELAHQASMAKALQVTRWGLVCLSPLGVALGPVTLLKSLSAEEGLPDGSPELEGLALARLQAAGGFVIWTALILSFAWWAQGRAEVIQQHLAIQCSSRLQVLGERIKRELDAEPTFPEGGGSLREALAEISERDPLINATHLRCPLAQDLYPYKARDREELTQGVDPGYILLWDREPHPDERGRTSYRALRFDGKIESFLDREGLNEGLAREPFGELAAPSPGASPEPSRAGEETPRVEPEARLMRFVGLAQECDRRDPWLESGLVVEALIFTERAGIPPQDLLPIALESSDRVMRRYGARMLARSKLDADKVESMTRGIVEDSDLLVRFAAARALQRVQRPFMRPLVQVIEQGEGELRKATLRLLGREAVKGSEEAGKTLSLMSTIRGLAQAKGDEAMFKLPTAALEHVVPHLGDPDMGREARAVFVSAGSDAPEPLKAAFRHSDPAVRQGAFEVARHLVEGGHLDLPGYLTRVADERTQAVQAAALEHFTKSEFAPDKVLTQWVLDLLREGEAQGPVLKSVVLILSRVGQGALPEEAGTVEQIVLSLTLDGEHSVVLDELASEDRLQNLQLDEIIGSNWKRFPDLQTRRRLIEILASRPYESAQRSLLLALADPEADVRAYAIQILLLPQGLRSARFRRDAARLVGKLLRKESDPLVRQRLLEFAQGKHVCGRYPSDDRPAKHTCSEPILSYLRGQAKKGDRTALRCLASHPSEQAISSLLEVLKSVSRDRNLASEVVSELKNLTGFGRVASDASGWERELAKRSAQLEKKLRSEAERERAVILRTNERAEKRAKDILKKSNQR